MSKAMDTAIHIILENITMPISCWNVVLRGDKSSLWVTQCTGESQRIYTGDEEDVLTLKKDMDMALSMNYTTITMTQDSIKDRLTF